MTPQTTATFSNSRPALRSDTVLKGFPDSEMGVDVMNIMEVALHMERQRCLNDPFICRLGHQGGDGYHNSSKAPKPPASFSQEDIPLPQGYRSQSHPRQSKPPPHSSALKNAASPHSPTSTISLSLSPPSNTPFLLDCGTAIARSRSRFGIRV